MIVFIGDKFSFGLSRFWGRGEMFDSLQYGLGHWFLTVRIWTVNKDLVNFLFHYNGQLQTLIFIFFLCPTRVGGGGLPAWQHNYYCLGLLLISLKIDLFPDWFLEYMRSWLPEKKTISSTQTTQNWSTLKNGTFVYWLDHAKNLSLSYLPTPPLGQDMTQGQFLSRV